MFIDPKLGGVIAVFVLFLLISRGVDRLLRWMDDKDSHSQSRCGESCRIQDDAYAYGNSGLRRTSETECRPATGGSKAEEKRGRFG